MPTLDATTNLTLQLKASAVLPSDTSVDGATNEIFVNAWRNLASAGSDFFSSNGFPRLIAGGPGRAYIDFDGTDDYFDANSSNLNTYFGVGAGTVFVVFAVDAIVTNNGTISNNDQILGGVSGTSMGLVLKNEAAPKIYAWNNDGTEDSFQKSIATPVNTGILQTAVWRHGSQLQIALDDPLDFTSGASGNTTTIATPMRIGRSNAATNHYFNGRIYEILAYDANLSLKNIQRVFNYLAATYPIPATPRGDADEQARDVASRRLWAFRRPRLLTHQSVPLVYANEDLLNAVAASHPRGLHAQGSGWGNEIWQRRPLRLVESELDPTTLRVDLVLADLREVAHTYRETCVAIKANDARRIGCASSSRGAFRQAWRSSNAWVEDPADPKTVTLIAFGREKIAAGGLLIEGASSNRLLRSSFVNGTTGLTLVTPGSSTIAVYSGQPQLFDPDVTVKGLQLTAGNPHAADTTATWPATSVTTNDARVSIDHWDRDGTALEWQLQRASDSKYWRDSDGTWQVAVTWNALPISTATEILRSWSKPILTGIGTATFRLGLTAGGTVGRRNVAYHVQLHETNVHAYQSRIVTTTAEVFTERDNMIVFNRSRNVGPTSAVNSTTAHHGTINFKFKPTWNSADVTTYLAPLVGVDRIYLVRLAPYWQQRNDPLGWQVECYYDADTLTWKLSIYGADKTLQGSATLADTVVRGQEKRITIRWTSSQLEEGLAAYAWSLFVDGVKGTDFVDDVAISADFMLDMNYPGSTGGYRSIDAQFIAYDAQPYALSADEIAAWGT